MATLRKRGDNYFIDYRIYGKRVRKTVGPSLEFAKEAIKSIESEVAKAKAGLLKKDAPYVELLAEFTQHCTYNISPSSRNRYRSMLDNFDRFLNTEYPRLKKVSEFKLSIFRDYQKFRQGERASNRTVNAELTVLRMMFRLSMQWGYIDANPTDGSISLEVVREAKFRYLSGKECRALLDACDAWQHPIFYALLNTGMKKQELENLLWEDVDLGARTISIAVKARGTSVKSIERIIPINDKLHEVLLEQVYQSRGSVYVFTDEKGEKIHKNRLRVTLIALAKKCGFTDVTHLSVLRHTFAAHLVMSGASLSAVKKLMGFSAVNTAMIYDSLREQEVDVAIERLEF